ncbi:MAG: T9SS type A sorting domain-containing protein, partial [Bacteroidota bacterium]|nr:T9SS type A sorting domain-containing protein [Bacteroidota bacterium]
GQNAVQMMTGDTFKLESGYIPGLRRYSGSYTTLAIQLQESWNLISVPLIVGDYKKSVIFPSARSDAFGYTGSYVLVDPLKNCVGYWLKFPAAETTSITGTGFQLDTIDVSAGWNMIGPPSYPVLITDIGKIPPSITLSKFFGYKENYYEEDTLKPGFGYWVKTSGVCKLVLKTGSVLSAAAPIIASTGGSAPSGSSAALLAEEHGFNSLTFTDVKEISRVLYFSAKPIEGSLEQYELPPSPPGDIFDVRFGSQRIIEAVNHQKNTEAQQFNIKITGAKNPLTIQWRINPETDAYSLELRYKGNTVKEYPLIGTGKIVINPAELISVKLLITLAGEVELPKEFALHQNYPNPFNPTTKIKYDLPKDSKVSLKIYNLLGQEVLTLVDENQNAGFKSVTWDAGDLPSGVYIYKLSAESEGKSFVDVRKVVLMK